MIAAAQPHTEANELDSEPFISAVTSCFLVGPGQDGMDLDIPVFETPDTLIDIDEQTVVIDVKELERLRYKSSIDVKEPWVRRPGRDPGHEVSK